MKVIYIAGKYRANTELELERNIRLAEVAALKWWKVGWAVICPHKNTAHFGGLLPDKDDDCNLWINGDLEILSRCDAIYMLSNWKDSKGAKLELECAKDFGLEIFYEESEIHRSLIGVV